MSKQLRFQAMKCLYRIATYLFLSAVYLVASVGNSYAQAEGQKTFSSSRDALTTFIEAVRAGDPSELAAILGPGSEQIVASSDSVADTAAREAFLKWYNEGHSLVPSQNGELTLEVGKNNLAAPDPTCPQGRPVVLGWTSWQG